MFYAQYNHKLPKDPKEHSYYLLSRLSVTLSVLEVTASFIVLDFLKLNSEQIITVHSSRNTNYFHSFVQYLRQSRMKVIGW
jgi:hypothetical protein